MARSIPAADEAPAVLVIFTVFAVCALFTFGAALYEMGRENGRRIEIEHIRELDLRQRQDSINLYKYYDYGTEQESDGLPESGEA